MSQVIVIGIIFLLVFIMVLLLFLAKMQKQLSRKKKAGRLTISKKKKSGFIPTTTYLKLYARLDHNFVSRQSVRKLNSKLMELGIFDHIEARIQATKIFIISTILMAGLAIFGTVAFGDLFMGVVFLIAATVAKDTILKKTIDKYYYKMLEQLSEAVAELRQAFTRTGAVVDALSDMEVGNLLTRQFAAIQDILTSEDAEHKLEEFYMTAPIKVLQTLAGICYAIDNGGDSILANGQSNFTNSLSYISEEVKMEIRKLKLQQSQFGSLEFMPLVPLVILAPLSSFLGDTIPGTAIIYNGTYGYAVRLLIVISSFATYLLISKINSAIAVEFDDRPQALNKLLNQKKWRRIVRILLPTRQATLVKKMAVIRGSLSRLTLELLYLKKAFYAVGVFFSILLIMLSSIYLGLAFEITNISKAAMTKQKPYTVEEEEKLRQLDKYYLNTTTMTEEELSAEMKSLFPRMKDDKREGEIKRMMDKRTKVLGAGFKFYHLWICLAVAAFGFHIPEIQLRFRRWLIQTESEEDCLQLQTIISILMNTTLDTLELLDWLAKHSRVHQHILIDALHEYPSDPDLALGRLKQRASLSEFKRIITKLLMTVSQVSIADAFSDLAQERHHLNSMREVSQTEQVKKKRSRMSPISMVPLVEVVGLYFIGPIAIVGISEFSTVFANLPL